MWLWGILFAIVFVLVNLNLPRIPIDERSLTTTAIIIVTLGAAILGGLAGMHLVTTSHTARRSMPNAWRAVA